MIRIILTVVAFLSTATTFAQAVELLPTNQALAIKNGDKGVMTPYPWVTIRNLKDFTNGEGDGYVYGSRCATEPGAVITVIGPIGEKDILVRYQHTLHQKGSNCPGHKDVLFSMPREDFLKMKQLYDERAVVEKILADSTGQ